MTVLVYGASGWTGRLVAAALDARGVPLALAGRDGARLSEVSGTLGSRPPVYLAALTQPAALRRAAAGARVVINCAGPFVEASDPVVEAAIDSGASYLDISGEESQVAGVHARWSGVAQAKGLTLCPGFGAKGALGDWGARVAADLLGRTPPVDEVAVAYAHGLKELFQPSIGSVLSAAGQGLLRPTADPSDGVRRFTFPRPFGEGLAVAVPTTENVSIPRHLPTRRMASFVAIDPGGPVNGPWTDLLLSLMPAMPVLARIFDSAWGRWHLDLYLRRPELQHDDDSFAVAVDVTAGGELAQLGIVTHDAYAVTGDVVALGIERLLREPAPPAGVLAPSELCPPHEALSRLQTSGAIRVFQRLAAIQGWS